MTDVQKRKLRLVEQVALLACAAVLLTILTGYATSSGSFGAKRFLLTADTNGVPHLYGVSLANPYLRSGVLRVIAIVGGEVEFLPPKGWMLNPTVKSNVWIASAAINRFGLSPGDKAIKERHRMEQNK